MGRKRQARNENLKQTLERYKYGIHYPYAGNRKTMEELFPQSKGYWDLYLEKKGTDYFSIIPSEVFKDKKVIEQYGKNLRDKREKKKWLLEDVEKYLKITIQAVSEIEKGNRKNIDRDYLMLFCALYEVSPEELMGLGEPPKVPCMLFDEEEAAKKNRYIMARLLGKNNELLDTLRILTGMPLFRRNELRDYLSNTPRIKMLSSNQIKKTVKDAKRLEFEYLQEYDESEEHKENEKLRKKCIDDMCRGPELLDYYVSIAAADEKTWEVVLNMIRCSGYLEVAAEENK